MCDYGNCKRKGKYSFDLLLFFCKKHFKRGVKEERESGLLIGYGWKVQKEFKIDDPQKRLLKKKVYYH